MRGADDRAVSTCVVIVVVLSMLRASGTATIGPRPERRGLRAFGGRVASSATMLILVIVLSMLPVV
jgi:hypothetical protein